MLFNHRNWNLDLYWSVSMISHDIIEVATAENKVGGCRMIKALMSDIDGTIIRKGEISDDTRHVIQHYMKDGLVILNTGRSFESIQSLKQEMNFDQYDFAVTCNGSYICTHDGKVLLNTTLPENIVKELLKTLPKSELKIAAAGHIYKVDYPYSLPEGVKVDEVNKISIRVIDNPIQDLLQQAVAHLDVRLEMNTHYADLIPIQCNKGEGARYLIRMLGIYEDEVLAIGDDYNDIAMLESFPQSYTFKSSPVLVQSSAQHIIETYGELPLC